MEVNNFFPGSHFFQVEYYEIEKLDPLTGQWIPCGKSTEPEFNVTGLQEGKPYKFRVKAVNKEGESEELEQDKSFIAKNPFGKSFEFVNGFISGHPTRNLICKSFSQTLLENLDGQNYQTGTRTSWMWNGSHRKKMEELPSRSTLFKCGIRRHGTGKTA